MVPSPMYVPEGVPGILVQPALGSFPWNRVPCKRTQDWMLYANQVVGGPRYYPRRVTENPQRERLEEEEEEEESLFKADAVN